MDEYISQTILKEKYPHIPRLRKPGENRDGLINLIKDALDYKPDIKTMVEIGSFAGESSEIFAKWLPNTKIYCIDPWNDMDVKVYMMSEKTYRLDEKYLPSFAEDCFNEVKEYYPNITKIKNISEEAVNLFDKIDMIYIDGIHTAEYIRKDLDIWIPKVVDGGIIAGHDYSVKFHDYKKEIFFYFNKVIPKKYSDTSWIHFKSKELVWKGKNE